MVKLDDPYSAALAYEVCQDPNNIKIPVNETSIKNTTTVQKVKTNKTAIIVGLLVPVISLSLLIALAIYCYRKYNKSNDKPDPSQGKNP